MSRIFPENKALLGSYSYQARVRYYDVDAMGRVHHSAYLKFMEDARTEMLRDFGITYKEIEESGVFMPVSAAELSYKTPLVYDEVFKCTLYFYDEPTVRMPVYFRIFNADEQMVVEARIELCFIDTKRQRPVRASSLFMQFFEKAKEAYSNL